MKKTNKRLHLEHSTIRTLVNDDLRRANGGEPPEDSSGTETQSSGPTYGCPSQFQSCVQCAS
jgi:hypothetical protein